MTKGARGYHDEPHSFGYEKQMGISVEFHQETNRLLTALIAQAVGLGVNAIEAQHFTDHGEYGLALESLVLSFDGRVPVLLADGVAGLASRMEIDLAQLTAR